MGHDIAKLKVTLPTAFNKHLGDARVRVEGAGDIYVRDFQVRTNAKDHEMELVLVNPAFGFDYEVDAIGRNDEHKQGDADFAARAVDAVRQEIKDNPLTLKGSHA